MSEYLKSVLKSNMKHLNLDKLKWIPINYSNLLINYHNFLIENKMNIFNFIEVKWSIMETRDWFPPSRWKLMSHSSFLNLGGFNYSNSDFFFHFVK